MGVGVELRFPSTIAKAFFNFFLSFLGAPPSGKQIDPNYFRNFRKMSLLIAPGIF